MTKAILEKWMVAQKRHRLSDKQVQMARELGLNPDKLGKIDNHKQEAWKAPLGQEEATESEEGGTEETACPLFRF